MKTNFILLAAGQSTRMKADKALLDFQGKPWIQQQVQSILNSKVVRRLTIVDQPAKTAHFKKLLQPLQTQNFEIRFVENSLENSSPSDSIFCAVQSDPFVDGSFISPIDVPFQGETLQNLLKGRKQNEWALKPSYQGHGGHPVWLSAEAIGAFRNSPQRLDEFFAQLPKEKVGFIELANPWIQLNLNTPADWQQFLSELRGFSHS